MQQTVYTGIILICLCIFSGTAAAAQGQAKHAQASEYTITIIPYYGPEKLWAKFSPLVEYLQQTTKKPWELKLYRSYDATINALCAGEVSFALLGPVPLARGIERCDLEISAVAVAIDGSLFYRSVIVTMDPAISSLSQLRGLKIGMFRGSTAAHIIPFKMLLDEGIYRSDIRPVFFEDHDRVMNALLDGEVAAAGVKDSVYKRSGDTRLRVLKTSEPLPNYVFAASPKLRNQTKALFADALLRLKPQKNLDHRRLMLDWDDEIKNGFVLPPASYRSSVMELLDIYREVMDAK